MSIVIDPTYIQFDDGSRQLNAAAPQIISITATVNGTGGAPANGMRITLNPCALAFRSTTLSSGAVTYLNIPTALTLNIPQGATLGAVDGVAARFIPVVYNNAGTPVLGVINVSGGAVLDGTNLVSPTTISAGATSASTFYSASAVGASSAYTTVGFVDNTQATAGTYVTTPSLVQGKGGGSLDSLMSLGYGQTWQDVTGSRALGTTYYNTTGKPIQLFITCDYGGAGSLTAFVSGAQIGLVTIATTSTVRPTMSFVVPPGRSYLITTSTGPLGLIQWSELR